MVMMIRYFFLNLKRQCHTLRSVEPNIYSVMPNNEIGNGYDSQFSYIYDLIACNPSYNRIIFGVFKPQTSPKKISDGYSGLLR